MLLVPISAEVMLPHVVRAVEASGHAGLMVVLARTAEAQELHGELTDYWTSLHSVTGSLVAILCPDPEVLNGGVSNSDMILNCHALRLRHPPDLPGFANRFGDHFNGTIYESLPNEYHEDWTQFGFRAVSQIPQAASMHRDAWTEAASRCAAYFGIAEKHLPSVLLLSLWEREAVLFSVHFRSTLFALCKKLAIDLGETPGRIDQLKTREELLTGLLGDLADARSGKERGVLRERPDTVSQERIVRIHDELALMRNSHLELTDMCRRELRGWMENGRVGDSLRLLTQLYGYLRELPWTRELPNQDDVYFFLMDATWHIANGEGDDLYREQVRRTEAALADVTEQLRALRQDLRLAQAAEAAGRKTFGNIEVSTLLGRAALKDWRLQIVTEAEQPPLRLKRKRS